MKLFLKFSANPPITGSTAVAMLHKQAAKVSGNMAATVNQVKEN
jgi:hypothetical protein